MAEHKLPEVWLRGPLPNIPSLLQPVAHALLQAVEEVKTITADFPEELVWEGPAGLASPGFHLLHLQGVLDRLLTYARGERLSEEQLRFLAAESKNHQNEHNLTQLVSMFEEQVNKALKQIMQTDEKILTEARQVGRAGLPSTVIGLVFHVAEHTMRHVGQLLVTVRILKEQQHLKQR